MREITYVEPVLDDDGYVIDGGYRTWPCDCGKTVYRYMGESDVSCECGAWYNGSAQRLRDDWMDNPSWKYGDCGDMEGFELQHAGDDY